MSSSDGNTEQQHPSPASSRASLSAARQSATPQWHLSLEQVAPTPAYLALDTSKDEVSKASQGILFQCQFSAEEMFY